MVCSDLSILSFTNMHNLESGHICNGPSGLDNGLVVSFWEVHDPDRNRDNRDNILSSCDIYVQVATGVCLPSQGSSKSSFKALGQL